MSTITVTPSNVINAACSAIRANERSAAMLGRLIFRDIAVGWAPFIGDIAREAALAARADMLEADALVREYRAMKEAAA